MTEIDKMMDRKKWITELIEVTTMKADILNKVIDSPMTASIWSGLNTIKENYHPHFRSYMIAEFLKDENKEFYVGIMDGTYKVSIEKIDAPPKPKEKKKWYQF